MPMLTVAMDDEDEYEVPEEHGGMEGHYPGQKSGTCPYCPAVPPEHSPWAMAAGATKQVREYPETSCTEPLKISGRRR